jgi:adenylate cyclase
MAFGAAVILSRFNVAVGVAFALLAAGGWIFAGVAAFYAGYLLDVANPVAALMVAAAAALVYRVASERQTHREVVDLFGRHVSQQVVSELVDRADRGQLELGGEVREVTVMFCDVRGYTTFSQGLDPAELVGILNQSFDAIVTSVTGNAGIVNKFNGDALMAFWNAPHEQPDPAYLACCAARDAIERLSHVSGPRLNWGFGITTGPALAGNVGSAGRFEYTLMGETVNTASRLSGVAPGSEIWVDARTRELLAGRFVSEELPPQSLKGMAEPVIPYRLVLTPAQAQQTAAGRQTVEVAS